MMSDLLRRAEVLYPSDLDSRIARERAAWYDRVVGAAALQVTTEDLSEVTLPNRTTCGMNVNQPPR
jgi:hypothetical protein